MTHRLHHDEGQIERNRDDRDEPQLQVRIIGAGDRRGKIGQHQRQHRQRGECRERSAGAGDAELLFAVSGSADEHREADDAVQNDHHRREHRVARQRRIVVGSGEHQCDDQRHFDQGDGKRQQQRAERLADLVRHDLGMMHRRQHRADEPGSDEQRRDRQMRQRERHQRRAQKRGGDGPDRQAEQAAFAG